MSHSLALKGFEDLSAHPVKWVASRLALYITVIAGTVVVVLGAAGLYALLGGEPLDPAPTPDPAPVSKETDRILPDEITPPPLLPSPEEAPSDGGAYVEWVGAELPVSELIGLPIFANGGAEVGTVTDFILTNRGEARMILENSSKESFVVPAGDINWKAYDATMAVPAVGVIDGKKELDRWPTLNHGVPADFKTKSPTGDIEPAVTPKVQELFGPTDAIAE